LNNPYDSLFKFEQLLANYTGAPYAVVTTGCSHSLELCFRYKKIKDCKFTAFTYLSIIQLMHILDIDYELLDEQWSGEYQFHGTNIWDSARMLKRNMYRSGQMQCLSFGNGKPLQLGRVGAVLTDDKATYNWVSRARSDGRDLRITPWQSVGEYKVGYHYCPTLEDCQKGVPLLNNITNEITYQQYPDLRLISIINE
jgi:dTDP-4-amino-4,6-dideoxygalactose transaminase